MSLLTFVGFSKGWKEAFMSGEQEPWVFRGGLTADLQVSFIYLPTHIVTVNTTQILVIWLFLYSYYIL